MLNNVPEDAPANATLPPARARMPPDERRRQLVGIGLGLLRERPLEAITVDEVARRAGISRGLLFHYFPTKNAYHQAVAAAGLRRLLRAVRPDPARPPAERLRAAIDGYLAFVERRHGRVMEMVRGSWAADAELTAALTDARTTIADGLLAAADAGQDGDTGPGSRAAPDGRAAPIDEAAPDGRAEPNGGETAERLLRAQSARAWLAFAEQLALDWVAAPSVARDRLLDHLEATFRAAVGPAA